MNRRDVLNAGLLGFLLTALLTFCGAALVSGHGPLWYVPVSTLIFGSVGGVGCAVFSSSAVHRRWHRVALAIVGYMGHL